MSKMRWSNGLRRGAGGDTRGRVCSPDEVLTGGGRGAEPMGETLIWLDLVCAGYGQPEPGRVFRLSRRVGVGHSTCMAGAHPRLTFAAHLLNFWHLVPSYRSP